MADEYQPGDVVKVYATGFNASIDAGGYEAKIVRQMPDADDFEVIFRGEVPEGTSPIVTTDRLTLVKRATAKAAKPAAAVAPEPEAPAEAEQAHE